jgi:hypothetical protein
LGVPEQYFPLAPLWIQGGGPGISATSSGNVSGLLISFHLTDLPCAA